jgi:hypothetical protein
VLEQPVQVLFTQSGVVSLHAELSQQLPARQAPPQQTWPLGQGALPEQMLQTLLTQVGVGLAHGPPQEIVPPQPSSTLPQLAPPGQAPVGVQPQTFGVPGLPPPQVSGAVQEPQLIVPPQPSAMSPQSSGDGQEESGVQPQTPEVPPPPHVSGGAQLSQGAPPVPQAALVLPCSQVVLAQQPVPSQGSEQAPLPRQVSQAAQPGPHWPPQPSGPQSLPAQSGTQTQLWSWHSSWPVQTSQAPVRPQAALDVPGWHSPLLSQQPSQLSASQMQAPPWHACPLPQAAQDAPFTPH